MPKQLYEWWTRFTALTDEDWVALVRPTFDGTRPTVETFLLDWSGDLYGRTIEVDFVARLRDERRFDGIDALKAQLARDVDAARAALGA